MPECLMHGSLISKPNITLQLWKHYFNMNIKKEMQSSTVLAFVFLLQSYDLAELATYLFIHRSLSK